LLTFPEIPIVQDSAQSCQTIDVSEAGVHRSSRPITMDVMCTLSVSVSSTQME
ncbi:hypothetical protein BgiBS90_010253, partial [Biomphalaria glabrata]